jgi:hypothetical protein
MEPFMELSDPERSLGGREGGLTGISEQAADGVAGS